MSRSDYTEYILRFSYGKDSFKCLDVIHSRRLPLDRITTTDVWATDTVPAWLPPMQDFKDRMDEWIWTKYRLEVEHLCAMNKDGTKKTYEQMFYHVPKRKVGGDSCPMQFGDFRICGILGVSPTPSAMPSHRVQGTITGFPPNTGYNWCQKLKIVRTPYQGMASVQREAYLVPKAQSKSPNTSFQLSAPRGAEKQISWNIWALPQMSRTGLAS